MSQFQIRRTSTALGAEITGIDLRELDEATLAQLRTAFNDYGVLFFRDQAFSPDDHIVFAERWAPIEVNRFFRPVDGYPRIAEVRKEPEQTGNIGGGWHTDHSYDQVPAMGSILYAREVPEAGGDTLFASMGAAYDALSDGFRALLDGLRAQHSNAHVFGAAAQDQRQLADRLGNADSAGQEAIHPVVIRHPATGRRLLYVNPGFTRGIVGWHADESDALLRFLYTHCARPEFTTRLSWRPGSIAFWDNRATWHFALNDYQGERRLMHRITLQGVPLH